MSVSVLRPILPTWKELAPYVEAIDRSRIYSNYGPLIEAFELELCKQFGLEPGGVATVANATDGLTLVLRAYDCRPGRYCVMPAWTFVASPLAAMAAQLVPYFVDVDPETMTMGPEHVLPLLKEHPSEIAAVMPVAPFGRPIDPSIWEAFQADTGIPVIVDGAAAFDAQKPSIVPTVVSLHATKALGIGEGGFVMVDDKAMARKVRTLSNFGFQGERVARLAGSNAKLSEYHAAVGLAALAQWPRARDELQSVATSYRDVLGRRANGPRLKLQDGFGETWLSQTCIVSVPLGSLEAVTAALAVESIETRQWWGSGAQDHPATQGFPRSDLMRTSDLAATTLGLPFHRSLSAADIESVVETASNAILRHCST